MKNTITRVDALNFAIKTVSEIECYGHDEVARNEEVVMILNKIRDGIASRKTSETAKANARAKRASARAELLAHILPILTDNLTSTADTAITARELFAACKSKLPSDFTLNRVQYILLNDMPNVQKIETKGKPNLYFRKVD